MQFHSNVSFYLYKSHFREELPALNMPSINLLPIAYARQYKRHREMSPLSVQSTIVSFISIVFTNP